jgi:hypothetical protein
MPLSRLCPRGLLAVLALALVSLPPGRGADTEAEVDEATLKDAGVGTDGPALLAYFRGRTLSPADLRHLQEMVRQLGSDRFQAREEASRELVKGGLAAAPFLKRALRDPDVEVARRASQALEEIEAGPGPGLPMAAARVLARRGPPGAAAALLAFLPFADDSSVEDEVAEALAVLAGRPGPADPALPAALANPLAVKRAAAACALGRSRDAADRDAVRRLLADREPKVRLGAARGLLAGRDREAVPALVALVSEGPAEVGALAEEFLLRLAGDRPPAMPADDSPGKRRAAWAKWWADAGPGFDLARYDETPRQLGLTLVPEMHANKVWECGKDGKPLWEIDGLQCPIDAQVLPGNRVLVAELNGNVVTERDRAGRVLWRHDVNTPIACERLANGQTFIATNHRAFVVNREGKEVSSYAPENGFFIHSVQRLRNGHVACVSMEGTIREVDAAGKEVCSVPLALKGGWSGIEGVPGNHYLVVNNSAGKVFEVDRAGKTVWEYAVGGACYASRLPNGHTLVVSNQAGLLEVDRGGKTVWSRTLATSLWRAHRR